MLLVWFACWLCPPSFLCIGGTQILSLFLLYFVRFCSWVKNISIIGLWVYCRGQYCRTVKTHSWITRILQLGGVIFLNLLAFDLFNVHLIWAKLENYLKNSYDKWEKDKSGFIEMFNFGWTPIFWAMVKQNFREN